MLEAQIRRLDDATAIRVLQTISDATERRLKLAGETPVRWSPEVESALREAFGESDAEADAPVPSAGEVARRTILWLSADPAHQEALAHLTAPGATTRSFEIVSVGSVAVVGLIMIAMQTEFEAAPDENGRTKWKIKKRPAPNDLLKTLALALLEFAKKLPTK